MNQETLNLAQIWRAVSKKEKIKIRSKGHVGAREPHLEFWDPLISGGRLKLGTSNLAQKWRSVSCDEKKLKLGQKGSCEVT